VTGSLHLLLQGFAGALSLPNLASAFAGAVLGTVVGVLPGIGPSTTVALLIPIAFKMSPDTALIMMTAVYCGAMYGGSLTSVLLKVPGEASSVMTAIDGHEMAKHGRAGSALAILSDRLLDRRHVLGDRPDAAGPSARRVRIAIRPRRVLRGDGRRAALLPDSWSAARRPRPPHRQASV
jgi:hypothetical protein